MRIEKLNQTTKKNLLEDLLKRSPNSYEMYEEQVKAILDNVKKRGDEALFEYTEKFDGFCLDQQSVLVKEEEIEEFYALVNKIKDMGESNLEFESAEYDENTIKEVKERRLSAVLMIKYKNVDKKLNCYITASYTSEFVSFFSNDSN